MTYPQWRTNVSGYSTPRSGSPAAPPVTDTAHRCGWQTTSSFIDTFRREWDRPRLL